MSKRAAVSALLVTALAGLVVLSMPTEPPHKPASMSDATAPNGDGQAMHHLLGGLDVDDGTHAILLHDLATGQGLRIVRDGAAIRSAQQTTLSALDRSAQNAVASSPTQSPETSAGTPDTRFVSLIQNKEIVNSLRCRPPQCRALGQDLAGLLQASLPLTSVREAFAHHDQARTAHFKLLSRADVAFVEPPDLPAPGTLVYPNQMMLHLPALVQQVDAVTPFDRATFTAGFETAFAHAFPDAEAYRLGPMQVHSYPAPVTGWPVTSNTTGGASLRDAAGRPIGLKGFQVIAPHISIEVIPAMADRLMAPEAFDAMPAFSRAPIALTQKLDALAQEVLGRPCPGCFQIALPEGVGNHISLTPLAPKRFTLTYHKVIQDEPPAQQ